MSMTIHDLIDLHAERVAMLAAFLRKVRRVRLPADNDIAVAVQERLLFVLDEMLCNEREFLKADRRYLRKTTGEQRARDGAAVPEFCDDDDTFAVDWDGTRLLDEMLEDDVLGTVLDLQLDQVHPITEKYPLRIKIGDGRLGKLAPIIRRIETEFEISFVIERIFFNEDQVIAFMAVLL